MSKAIVINSDSMGEGSRELGQKLLGAFLRKLWAADEKPDSIVFYNAGVKLLAKGSTVLDVLDGLSDSGVDLLACGTCVDYYQLKDEIVVGRVSNMEEISALFLQSASVITI